MMLTIDSWSEHIDLLQWLDAHLDDAGAPEAWGWLDAQIAHETDYPIKIAVPPRVREAIQQLGRDFERIVAKS